VAAVADLGIVRGEGCPPAESVAATMNRRRPMAYSASMGYFREIMAGLLGRWPEPGPLEARVEERVDLGDVVRERVSYNVEPGERAPAYLFVPRGLRPGERRAGVFAHHQHAGQFHLGKSEVAGLAGNPEQAYALDLARRGYIVLAPDAI
jgi:hypothetical protein